MLRENAAARCSAIKAVPFSCLHSFILRLFDSRCAFCIEHASCSICCTHRAVLEAQGVPLLDVATGLRALEWVVGQGLAAPVVTPLPSADAVASGGSDVLCRLLGHSRPRAATEAAGAGVASLTATEVGAEVAGLVSRVLGVPLERLEVDAPLALYGMDSLLAVELRRSGEAPLE
jgi:hypothetical protein